MYQPLPFFLLWNNTDDDDDDDDNDHQDMPMLGFILQYMQAICGRHNTVHYCIWHVFIKLHWHAILCFFCVLDIHTHRNMYDAMFGTDDFAWAITPSFDNISFQTTASNFEYGRCLVSHYLHI